MKHIIYYHKNCPDGQFGAFEAWKYFKNIDENVLYIPISTEDSIELNYNNSIIYFIDVFPKNLQNKQILDKAALNNKIVIIDHHKNCMKFLVNYYNHNVIKFTQNNKSGVSLANEFFKNKREFYVNYIEDWDLFKFEYKETEDFHYFIDSLESLDFIYLDELFKNSSEKECLIKGNIFKQYSETLIKRLLKNEYFTYITGKKIPCINSAVFISELGNKLSEKYKNEYPYVIIENKYEGYTKYSLRTVREDTDLSLEAFKFGGGGHKKAAGFIIKENI